MYTKHNRSEKKRKNLPEGPQFDNTQLFSIAFLASQLILQANNGADLDEIFSTISFYMLEAIVIRIWLKWNNKNK